MPMWFAHLSSHTGTRHSARLLLVLVLLVGTIPLIARGQAREVESVRVRYDAPPDCPDQDDFFRELSLRTARVKLVETGIPTVRTFRISIARAEGRALGRLVVEDADRASVPRVVTGTTCEEVTRGLAVVVALVVDPDASPARTDAVASTADAASPEPPASTAPAHLPLASTPAQPHAAQSVTGPATADAVRVRLSFGIALGVTNEAPSGSANETSASVGGAYERPGLLSPSARLSLVRKKWDSQAALPASAHFVGTLGRLDGCPIRLRIFSPLSVFPCVRIEAGRLEANPSGVPNPSVHRPWVAAGLTARAGLHIIGGLMLEAQTAVAFPFLPEAFFFEPNLTVYTPPAVLFSATMGLGVEFP